MIWDKQKDYSSKTPFDVELLNGVGHLKYERNGKPFEVDLDLTKKHEGFEDIELDEVYAIKSVSRLFSKGSSFNGTIKVV